MKMNKENQSINLPNIIQQTLLVPDLAEKKPWKKGNFWVDQLCAAVNLIPLVGGAIASEVRTVTDAINSYQASELLRKFVKFLYGLENLGDKERIEFLKELEEKAQDASGNVMLSIIDSLDNINKQKILANLVVAKGKGHISIEEFFRLESVLQRIPYVDLNQLSLYQSEYYDENGDTELLYSTGVLRPASFGQDGDTYVLSTLGVNLLKWGMNIDITPPQIKGATAGIGWEEIGPISDDEVKDIVNKTIYERECQQSDRAMFDYDVARGK